MVSLSAVFISEQPITSNARHKRSGDDEADDAESGMLRPALQALVSVKCCAMGSCALAVHWLSSLSPSVQGISTVGMMKLMIQN